MNKGSVIRISAAVLLIVPAVLDAIRFLKPDTEAKQAVLPPDSFAVSSATEVILVYNAYGGYYPGVVDIIRKEFFPESYPCNLCYQAFGTFGMKDEWKNFLDSLPLKVTKLHTEEFKRRYRPETMKLPLLMVADSNKTEVLLSAPEINQYHSSWSLLNALKKALDKR